MIELTRMKLAKVELTMKDLTNTSNCKIELTRNGSETPVDKRTDCTIYDTVGTIDVGPIVCKSKIDFRSVLVSDRYYNKKKNSSLIVS